MSAKPEDEVPPLKIALEISINKILINRKLDCLIDGKDTIRNFEVFLKDQLIMVYPKEDDRIYVYKFK